MRTAYKREKKKVERDIAEGADNVHVPTLWYYPYLSFLDEDVDPIAVESEYCNESDIKSEEPERKKPKISAKDQADQLVKKQMDFIDAAKSLLSFSGDESSADAFGRSISCQLKELPRVQRCLAEKLIGEVMFYAKMNQLNLDTVVYLNDDTESH